jgi:hypothetical protein
MTNVSEQNVLPAALTYDDVRAVSPALEHYTKGVLLDGLRKRRELSARDRSVVTVAALIAQTSRATPTIIQEETAATMRKINRPSQIAATL